MNKKITKDNQSDNKKLQRRKPNQARAQETKEKILAATHTILEESGINGLTTRSIAKIAGISIGSVYEYFPNKQAILFWIYEQNLSRGLKIFDDVFSNADDDSLMIDLFGQYRQRAREAQHWTRSYLELRNAEERDDKLRSYTKKFEDDLTSRYVSLEQERGAVLGEEQLTMIARFAHQVDHINLKLQFESSPEERQFYGRITTELFKTLIALTGCPSNDYKPHPDNLAK